MCLCTHRYVCLGLSVPTFASHTDLGTREVFQPDSGCVTGIRVERVPRERRTIQRPEGI